MTGILAAFGAGALTAALSVELVAPTVQALGEGEAHGNESVSNFVGLLLGAIAGGVLFVVLDQLVNAHGGFLRKSASTIAYLTKAKVERTEQIVKDLGAIPLIRQLPPERVRLLAEDVKPGLFLDGETLFKEGGPADRLFLIRDGEVALFQRDEAVRTAGAGETVGEIALVGHTPRVVTAKAKGDVSVLVLTGQDLERWRRICPEFDRSLKEIARSRLEQIVQVGEQQLEQSKEWAELAIASMRQGGEVPTPEDLRRMKIEQGRPIAVWLGILLDGIPESFVIGSGFLALLSAKSAVSSEVSFLEIIPYTLIAGLFLSNFPEALSSSAGMRTQGWSAQKILLMWTSLMVITALGAGVGYWLGGALPHSVLVAVEGIAAGAMLTMIASTLIPESVHLGGRNTVGLSTLIGFLSAVAFKLFE
ncbi:MAG: cyclic nucleotide-binding domain-containing protein [Planctomycetota bacterium]